MTLIDNAKEVLMKAWSIKFALLGALFSAGEVAIPYAAPTVLIPPGALAILAFVCSAGAAIARVVAQPAIKKS